MGKPLFKWNISDQSGIAEATVVFNNKTIRTYGPSDTISDSFSSQSIELGNHTLEIWAKDNDNDPGHNPSEVDWLESYNKRTITIYDDDEIPQLARVPHAGDYEYRSSRRLPWKSRSIRVLPTATSHSGRAGVSSTRSCRSEKQNNQLSPDGFYQPQAALE